MVVFLVVVRRDAQPLHLGEARVACRSGTQQLTVVIGQYVSRAIKSKARANNVKH